MNDKQKINKKPEKHWNSERKKSPQKDWGKIAKASKDVDTNFNPEEINPSLEHPDYQELAAKLTETEIELNKMRDDKLRLQAEMTNMLRRAERDVTNAHRYALDKFAFELLPIIDNLERSREIQFPENNELIKNIHTGVELTLKMFLEILQKFSIKSIDPIGETFNPEFHTAMTMQEDPKTKPNTILKVIQKGYLLKDRLLRPALVIVSKTNA